MMKYTENVFLVLARPNSKRLPRKHLEEIGDRNILNWIAKRVNDADIRGSKTLMLSMPNHYEYYVFDEYPTITNDTFIHEKNENNIIERIYKAVHYVVKKIEGYHLFFIISGDCPLISSADITIMKKIMDYTDYNAVCYDYKKTIHEGLFVFNIETIIRLVRYSMTEYQKQNQFPILLGNPKLFNAYFYTSDPVSWGKKWKSISVDTQEDLEQHRKWYEILTKQQKKYNFYNVVRLEKNRKE